MSEYGMNANGEAAVRQMARTTAEVLAVHAVDIPDAYKAELIANAEKRILAALWSAMFDTLEVVIGNPLENQGAGL